MDNNLSDAIYLAFGILVFILAISITMNMFNTFSLYSAKIFDEKMDPTKKRGSQGGIYMDVLDEGSDNEPVRENILMTKSSVAALLNRYYKESSVIKLYDESENLKQIFDLSLEQAVANISSKGKKERQNLKGYDVTIYNTYCNPTHPLSMFGAPWRGSNANREEKDRFSTDRVNAYILGEKKYINGILVDYENQGRNWFSNLPSDSYFMMTVIQYQYSGDVKKFEDKDELGEDIVIGGSPKDKLEINLKYVGKGI